MTAHQGESPDGVAFSFVFLTNFDRHDFASDLVVHVGTGESGHDVDAAVRRCALGRGLVTNKLGSVDQSHRDLLASNRARLVPASIR